MTSAELQRRILGALLQGPANHFAVAAAVADVPFRVSAELKELKRQRLVRELVSADRHAWVLTGAGCAEATNSRQEQIAL